MAIRHQSWEAQEVPVDTVSQDSFFHCCHHLRVSCLCSSGIWSLVLGIVSDRSMLCSVCSECMFASRIWTQALMVGHHRTTLFSSSKWFLFITVHLLRNPGISNLLGYMSPRVDVNPLGVFVSPPPPPPSLSVYLPLHPWVHVSTPPQVCLTFPPLSPLPTNPLC